MHKTFLLTRTEQHRAHKANTALPQSKTLAVMQDVFAEVDGTNTKLVTIFFGANDAARAGGPP